MPLDLAYWSKHCKSHLDKTFVDFILNSINLVVHIGYTGPSANQFKTHVHEAITENLNKGRVAGPLVHPPNI